MAHFYDCPNVGEKTDVEGNGFQVLDPVSRSALLWFWVAVGTGIIASAVFFLSSRYAVLPMAWFVAALLAGLLGLVSLYVLDRSVRRIHLVTPDQAKADRSVVLTLQQLDDRFAVFNGIREGETWIDHLIVGPSGVYALKTSMLCQGRERPSRYDLVQANEAALAVQKLLKRLLPHCALSVEPVLCVVGQGKPIVRQESHRVWLVTLDKMVPALLRRSGQQGSISKNVSVTGAFSADLPLVRALEQSLASHWELPKRPMFTDFLPSPNMLAGQN